MVKVADRKLSYTSNSKENSVFLIKCVIFVFICFVLFNLISPEYLNEYTGAILDKYDRLMSIEQSKIVLIGNSNLVFGIDSELLEDELGGMPVVNMGLHGGLGNVFHERMAILNVCDGDIYIICHTDYYDEDKIDNPELAWITIENHYELWRLIRLKDIPDMIDAFPIYLRKCINLYTGRIGNRDPGGAYSRSAFNEYGDCGLDRVSIYTTKQAVKADDQISEQTVNRINELSEFLEKKGAVLLVAGYPIGDGDVTDSSIKFKAISDVLGEKLTCPVISDFTDYMYDYSYFYDYNYLHLNTEGARLRTEQLAKDVRHWMENNQNCLR